LRLYFIGVGLIVPGFLDMLKNLEDLPVPNMVALSWTHIGTAEIGLAFWGKYLYDNQGKLELAKKIKVLTAILGYALIVLGNGYLSLKNGSPAEAFFVHTSLPSVIFGIGVFMTFSIFEKRLNALGAGAKSVISEVAGLTMGTYLMHMFVITVWGMIYPVIWEKLKSCQGVLLIGSAVFLICLDATFVLSRVPGVKKVLS
jgi:hypothetical protein